MKKILLLLLLTTACQKDYYLSDLQEAEATIERLNNSNSTLQSQLNELNNQVSTLRFENTNLQSENTIQTQQISDLQSQINQLQSDLQNSIVSLEQAQSIINELEEQIRTARRQQIIDANVVNNGVYRIIGHINDDESYTEYAQIPDDVLLHTSGISGWHYEIRNRSVINRGKMTGFYNETNAIHWRGTLREWQTYRVLRVFDENQIVIEWTYGQNNFVDTYVVELIEEELTDISEVQPTEGFWGDPVYSQIDWHNPNSYIEAFIQDAARHNVDLSHVRNQNWFSDVMFNHFATGAAYGVCRDYIEVRYHEGQWLENSWFDNHNERISLVWHELGHDVLNLDHNYENYNYDTGEGTFEIMGGFTWRGFDEYPDDPYWFYRNFVDMKTRMFEGIRQNYYDCDNLSGKTNQVIE